MMRRAASIRLWPGLQVELEGKAAEWGCSVAQLVNHTMMSGLQSGVLERIVLPELLRRRQEACESAAKRGSIDRFAIYRRDKGRCYLCGAEVPGDDFHVDHIIPVSRGGSNEPANLAVACPSCNIRKGARLREELDW